MPTVISETAIAAASRLKGLREDKAMLEKEMDRLRDVILQSLGDDTVGLTASGSKAVHIQVQNRRTINRDKLNALYPEVFEDVAEDNEVRIVKIDL